MIASWLLNVGKVTDAQDERCGWGSLSLRTRDHLVNSFRLFGFLAVTTIWSRVPSSRIHSLIHPSPHPHLTPRHRPKGGRVRVERFTWRLHEGTEWKGGAWSDAGGPSHLLHHTHSVPVHYVPVHDVSVMNECKGRGVRVQKGEGGRSHHSKRLPMISSSFLHSLSPSHTSCLLRSTRWLNGNEDVCKGPVVSYAGGMLQKRGFLYIIF